MDGRSVATSQLVRPDEAEDRRHTQDGIYLAVELLKSQHDVDDSAAFIMLVDASALRHLSIRETASCLADEALVSPRARQTATRIVRQRRVE